MENQSSEREITANAIDLRGRLDPKGIAEVVFEFDGGDTDIFRPKRRDEFKSYELHQMGGYIDAVIGTIRKGQRS